MNAYELELYKIAKARGDSITRQLADIVSQQADRIAELENCLSNTIQIFDNEWNDEIVSGKWAKEANNQLAFAKAIIKASRGEE